MAHQYLDKTGLEYFWSKVKEYVEQNGIFYGTCATAAATAAKVATVSGVTELKTGLTIAVKFTYANGKANPTLNVNSLGAVAIYRYGTTVPSTSAASSWNADSVVTLTYDGSHWQMHDWNNTTYSALSEADMKTGTATAARLITAQRLEQAVKYHAPVTSVNGNTGAVTVTEGLAPLMGTTSTVTPQQVMTALGEGRDVCLSADSIFNQVNITLKFTGFNRVTDSDYGGMAMDMTFAQTVASVDGVNFGVWTLVGGTYNNTTVPWTVLDAELATKAYAVPMTRTINGHALSSNLSLDPSDIGAIGLPNGANRGDFLVYSGTGWIPQSLSTWQGGNY